MAGHKSGISPICFPSRPDDLLTMHNMKQGVDIAHRNTCLHSLQKSKAIFCNNSKSYSGHHPNNVLLLALPFRPASVLSS